MWPENLADTADRSEVSSLDQLSRSGHGHSVQFFLFLETGKASGETMFDLGLKRQEARARENVQDLQGASCSV